MKTAEEIFENSGVSRINSTHFPDNNWYIKEQDVVKLMKAYAQQPAVSENSIAEIFANHADNTPYLNFTAFKEAIKELLNHPAADAQQSDDYRKITKNIGGLSEEADAQQRYERARAWWMIAASHTGHYDDALKIAAGLKEG